MIGDPITNYEDGLFEELMMDEDGERLEFVCAKLALDPEVIQGMLNEAARFDYRVDYRCKAGTYALYYSWTKRKRKRAA